MTTPDDAAPETQADPQTHLDTDPVNQADTEGGPASHTGEDEGRSPEGGANPTGPATGS